MAARSPLRRRPRHPSIEGRRHDTVVLKSAERHARSCIWLHVKVVKQRGLKTASVERREVDAARAPEDASVIAAVDDGERTRLRRETPCMGVGVKSAQSHEARTCVCGSCLAQRAEIESV